MTDDKQKIAMVTGAAGVLGNSTARGLAADGYRVVMSPTHKRWLKPAQPYGKRSARYPSW